MTDNKNVLWEVIWADGRREVVEARNLQQTGAWMNWFGKNRGEPAPECWELFADGRGVVLVAEKRLISVIRCLNPAGEPVE